MTGKELKEILEDMTEDELESDIVFRSTHIDQDTFDIFKVSATRMLYGLVTPISSGSIEVLISPTIRKD